MMIIIMMIIVKQL